MITIYTQVKKADQMRRWSIAPPVSDRVPISTKADRCRLELRVERSDTQNQQFSSRQFFIDKKQYRS
jgi:hypothetical protein